ncbi:hypothetical protein GPECTOR_38g251 [Gonium pectorale]|uniref:Protein kinase domain-containing protein n=1 Tax=Gonium pectorale TaxID=33097 RepID=A0A150GBT9_GONPE|nr:hypothetical protein GPECTOR_38g251 [Gonium pectorale]|eukprot:KXZ47015.1 hypothetical protein GPECTOR_38g251 [Gonium pectorale]
MMVASGETDWRTRQLVPGREARQLNQSVHEPAKQVDLLAKFESLCGEKLTVAQKKGLHCHNIAIRALTYGIMDKQMAQYYLREIDSRLKTSTRQAVLDSKGYIFEGQLASTGQSYTSMYYVFRGAGVYCSKVFDVGVAGVEDSMQLEKAVSEVVHSDQACPTLIKVLDAFRAGHHAVLILPLLARSAADLLAAASPGVVDDEATAYVAAGVLAAMAGLAAKGWCHGDIKPANIMLAAGAEKHVVLVDLGACTRFNEKLKEFTEHYALGLPKVASLQWDLACLASTLCILVGIPVKSLSVEGVSKYMTRLGDDLSFGGQLALHILKHLDMVDKVEQLRAVVWDEVMERVRGRLGEEHAATLAAWWPSPL